MNLNKCLLNLVSKKPKQNSMKQSIYWIHSSLSILNSNLLFDDSKTLISVFVSIFWCIESMGLHNKSLQSDLFMTWITLFSSLCSMRLPLPSLQHWITIIMRRILNELQQQANKCHLTHFSNCLSIIFNELQNSLNFHSTYFNAIL